MENAFIEAILEAPSDDFSRLPYADWLEERGDPRGEFLRVEVALFDHPSSDTHDALETRRRELLKVLDPEWVDLVRRLPLAPIDELRRVLPPPKRPLHYSGDWAAVERNMGLD